MSRRWLFAGVAGMCGALLAIAAYYRLTRFDLASLDPRHTWRPVISMPWVNYGFDFGGDFEGRKGIASEQELNGWFARLHEEGVRAISWFLFADGRASLRFDSAGYVIGIAPAFLRDYHSVLRLAGRHSLQVIWVLVDYEIGMPAQTAGTLKMFGHANLLEDPSKRASFLRNALMPLLEDRQDSNQIAGWLLINEPENIIRSGQVTESAVRAFVNETAAAIKRYRPDERIGLANADLVGMMEFADIDALDFLVFHHYRTSIPPPASFVGAYLSQRLKVKKQRPIFIGEFNLNHPPSADLSWFVKTVEMMGYSGVWPWSLRNRPNAAADAATDVAPRFPELHTYATGVRSRNANGAAWIESQLRQVVLPEVERRVSRLVTRQSEDPEPLEFSRRERSFELDWYETLQECLKNEQILRKSLALPIQ